MGGCLLTATVKPVKEITADGRARRDRRRASDHRPRRVGGGANARLRRGAGEHPGPLYGRPPGRSGPRSPAALCRPIPSWPTQLEACLAGIEFIHRATGPATDTPATLGEFRIIRELGRGGMGVVYEAEQTSLRRRVAASRCCDSASWPTKTPCNRFRREAETVARLHHTNIVPIFAVGCERGVHYYAMQLSRAEAWPTFWRNRSGSGKPLASDDVARVGPPGGRGPGACPPARGDPPRHQAVELAARR